MQIVNPLYFEPKIWHMLCKANPDPTWNQVWNKVADRARTPVRVQVWQQVRWLAFFARAEEAWHAGSQSLSDWNIFHSVQSSWGFCLGFGMAGEASSEVSSGGPTIVVAIVANIMYNVRITNEPYWNIWDCIFSSRSEEIFFCELLGGASDLWSTMVLVHTSLVDQFDLPDCTHVWDM